MGRPAPALPLPTPLTTGQSSKCQDRHAGYAPRTSTEFLHRESRLNTAYDFGKPLQPAAGRLTVTVSDELFVSGLRARAYTRRAARAPCTFTFTITRRGRNGLALPGNPPPTRRGANAQREGGDKFSVKHNPVTVTKRRRAPI